MAGLFDDVETLLDFAVRVPMSLFQLVASRKRELPRVTLLDEPRARARNERGARVHERDISEILRERDEVLNAESVHLEREIQGWIEIDDAGSIYDHVHFAAQLVA